MDTKCYERLFSDSEECEDNEVTQTTTVESEVKNNESSYSETKKEIDCEKNEPKDTETTTPAEEPETKKIKVDSIQNVLQSMNKTNVEKIVKKLYTVNFLLNNEKVEGVNSIYIPHQLRDLINMGREEKFDSGTFLNFFMGFLYDQPSKVIDSSFSPLPDEELQNIFENVEIKVTNGTNGKDDFIQNCKAIPFVYKNLDYLMVLMCKATVEYNQKTQKPEIHLDIVNMENIQMHIKEILKYSCEKIQNLKKSWKEILLAKCGQEKINGNEKYSRLAESMKDELQGSLERIYKHRLFDKFMENEQDIEIGSLYLTPTKGYTNVQNAFTCLELVDADNGKTFISKANLNVGDSDVRMYVCIKTFTVCYTEMNNCYLKGYVRWGLKLPNTSSD